MQVDERSITSLDDCGDEYLDQFDTLNLDQKEHRRLAMYHIDEFVRQVLAQVGQECLEFSEGATRNSPHELWGMALSKIESMEEITIPDGFDRLLHEGKQHRNKVAHNTEHDIPNSNLETLREICEDWRAWLVEHAERYDATVEDLTPREALIRMARESLVTIQNKDPSYKELEGQYEHLQNKADELERELDAIATEEEEITQELVDTISQIMSLGQDFEQAEEEEELLARHIQMQVDAYLEEKRMGER